MDSGNILGNNFNTAKYHIDKTVLLWKCIFIHYYQIPPQNGYILKLFNWGFVCFSMLSYPDSINQSKIDTTETFRLYNALLKFALAFCLASSKNRK